MTRKRERIFGGHISAPVALFADVQTPTTPEKLKISQIKLPKQQPRRYFDSQKMEQLTLSIKEYGILEPLLVRSIEDSDEYELVAGERRYRAAKDAGLTELPVIIRELSDEQAIQIALVENLQREDLNPIEETEGMLQLLSLKLRIHASDVPKLLYRMQHEAKGDVAHNVMGSDEDKVIQSAFTALGTMTWESFVNNRLPLLNLPQDILDALRQGRIAYTKAQAIARVKDDRQREILLDKAMSQDLSLAQIKEQIVTLKAAKKTEENGAFPSLKGQINDVLRLAKQSKV